MSLKIRKVLISDKVDSSCKEVLEKHSISVDYKPGLNKEELINIVKDYDALIVRSATKVTSDVFENAKNLKLVGRAGTGVDNIDLSAASKHGVLVMNTPGGNTLSAAEHTCALIAAVARHIGQSYASLVQGKWERSKFIGCELLGRTLAIIGLGRIGREVAHRMQSYGMKTIGFDPLVSKEEAESFGVEYLSIDEMWPRADFVTVHTPLIPQTKGLINSKVFEICKPGLKVVNVARGGIIDEADLLAALNDGKCGGAALDVFVTEPPKGISLELVKHPKVLSTPHLGASTTEAQLRVAREISEQIVDAVNGKPMVGLVNAPALAESGNPIYKPWMEVAEKLGKIVQSLHQDLKSVNVIIHGQCLESATKLIITSFSYGLAKCKDSSANLINAPSLIKEAGIEVKGMHVKDTDAIPEISIVVEKCEYNGVLSGSKPAVSKFKSVDLVTPVVLTGNFVTAISNTMSSKVLLKLLSDVEITSVSTGVTATNSVLVATVEGIVQQALQKPLTFVEL